MTTMANRNVAVIKDRQSHRQRNPKSLLCIGLHTKEEARLEMRLADIRATHHRCHSSYASEQIDAEQGEGEGAVVCCPSR